MEVCEANPRPRPLLVSRGSFFGSTFPSPHCRQISLQNKFRITLHLMRRNYSPHSSIICSSKARSSRDLHKVLWKIEADLADGQLLYITGDPIALGSWKPEMAVLMSPTEGTNLWMAEVKVPCGTNFRYSYFIREDKCSLYDLIWRPGPEFSVSVPLPSKQKERILVRDSWLTVPAEGLPVHSWDSWLEETCLTVEPAASATSGVTSDPYSIGKDDDVNFSYKLDAGETVSERYQPVEEPWLHQSSFFFLELNKLDMVVFDTTSDKNDSTSDKNDSTERFFSKNDHDEENLEDESRLACLEEPVSIDILINSSVCTMQRIAVLEDGKLVELLLEPVKNNVQCDSVYLGVISKLVPNMGGAFVNIGTSKPSLMGIKHYREPFAFPPFRSRSKRKKSNGSVLIEYKEDADANDCESASHDDADIIHVFADSDYQDSLVKLMNGDFEENEIEDDCDVEDASKQNLNGSIIDYGRDREGDSDDDAEDKERYLDNETFNGFLGSLDSQLVHDGPESVNACSKVSKWDHVRKGTKVIVQVVKEGLGSKGPMLSPYPHLRSRFWVLITRCERIGVSKKIPSVERTRLRLIAKTLQPPGFGLTVRTVAAGHSLEELQKDLEGLLLTWNNIVEHAKSVALAADEGVEGAMPVILHQAMGKTLSVAQDYFNDKVKSMVVDSPRTYHEITSYLHEIAPDLCDRVDLYDKRTPIFDEYGIEEEINNMLSKRVPLLNGGSLVIEQTEALVSIDVNGGHGMLAQGNSQQKAILEVNLAAAKQIARELRLRDIGGIIVVDFIDMVEDMNKRLVYEEVKRSAARDRSSVRVSELSRHGLMEITRKRVRPSVTYMISEPCICCHATGRVEALATSFSKIEHEICRLLASTNQKEDSENPKSWPKFSLWVDRHMCNYLTSGKKTKLALLSSSLKVWLILKVARGFSRGEFEVKPFTDNKENNDENEAATSRSKPTEDRSHMPTSKLKLFPMKKWKTSRK